MILKRAFSILIVFLQVLVAMPSQAAKFKGYNRTSNSNDHETVIELPLEIEASDTQYYISISRHAALYHFPRQSSDADKQFKLFFDERIKEKRPLQFTIDLRTGEILFVKDLESTKKK